MTIVQRTGWHDLDRHPVFILPNESIGLKGGETVILHKAAHGPFAAKGSVSDWQAGVGKLAYVARVGYFSRAGRAAASPCRD